MSSPMPATRALPAVPSLEQQKKQARELLDAARTGDADAIARIRAFHPRPPIDIKLHDAQLVIAREYGYASWPKLKAAIETMRAEHIKHPIERDAKYYDERAHGLLETLRGGLPDAIAQAREWHPELAAWTDEEIVARARSGALGIDDARLVYAREHGFADWSKLRAHVDALANGAAPNPFMDVVESGKRGDWPRVQRLLREHPWLVRARGTNGNTLLNLAGAMAPCAPTTDGPLAGDRLAAVKLLLALGADPSQPNDRGWTPLHQASYRGDVEQISLMLDAGARVDRSAHGDGGTPLVVALFWGHRTAADRLAQAAVVPSNLRVAAGLGRIDLVERCFASDGTLTDEARAHRGFYRPHSGFPTWAPSNDAQEVLDESLAWAARNDRVEVLPVLVAHGAHVDADVYRGTALAWAATRGHVRAIATLLDLGADPNRRATFGGLSHGDGVTALHLAASDDHVEAVKLLLARGADPTIRDANYNATAAGWAQHAGAVRALAVLEAWLHEHR